MNKLYVFWLMLMLLTGLSLNFAACGSDDDTDGDIDGDIETDGDAEEDVDTNEVEADGDDEQDASEMELEEELEAEVQEMEIEGDEEAEVQEVESEVEIEEELEAEIQETEVEDEVEIQELEDEAETEDEVESQALAQVSISDCGGFDATTKSRDTNPYCKDHTLIWEYNSATGELILTNTGVFLNCCGIQSMDVSGINSGGFLLEELDEPGTGGIRCNCMCMFDFMAEIKNVTTQNLPIKITRLVTDMSSQQTQNIWEGSIDLSQAKGEILIEANVGWCY